MSKRCPDTLETLSGHLLDTGMAPETLPRHSLVHPDFRGHSLGHSPGHFGPEGPEASCRESGMSQIWGFMVLCFAARMRHLVRGGLITSTLSVLGKRRSRLEVRSSCLDDIPPACNLLKTNHPLLVFYGQKSDGDGSGPVRTVLFVIQAVSLFCKCFCPI